MDRVGVAVRVGLWPAFFMDDCGAEVRQLGEACEKAAPVLAKTSEGRAADVERSIAPAIEAMGYDIVRVVLSGSRHPRLQIMAER